MGSFIGLILLIVIVVFLWFSIRGSLAARKSTALAGPEVQTLTIEGFTFRDLNKNGKLDIYEDIWQPRESRVDDLLSQMNLVEKAGMMFIPPVSMRKDGTISEKASLSDIFSLMSPGTSSMLFGRNINHFNIFFGTTKKEMAIWHNNLQKLAERTRLGIPVSIASDPRNHFSNNILTGAFAGEFSLWPEPAGLAADGDSLGATSVACMTKHFSGGGPQKEGIDPLFPFGSGLRY
jgi:beta-glucosidase